MILLQVIDSQWKDHLLEMDHLKEGIGLRGYGQKDPLIEYKKEGFEMFQSMLDRIEEDAVRYLFLIQPVVDQPAPVRRQTPVYYQQPTGPLRAAVQAGPGHDPRQAPQALIREPRRSHARRQDPGGLNLRRCPHPAGQVRRRAPPRPRSRPG